MKNRYIIKGTQEAQPIEVSLETSRDNNTVWLKVGNFYVCKLTSEGKLQLCRFFPDNLGLKVDTEGRVLLSDDE